MELIDQKQYAAQKLKERQRQQMIHEIMGPFIPATICRECRSLMMCGRATKDGRCNDWRQRLTDKYGRPD